VSLPSDGATVVDARLEACTIDCPDCDVRIHGTGRMTWSALSRRWFVEYWCPQHRGPVPHWHVSLEPLLREVAEAHGFPPA
jgi:hypothetical protein